MWIKQKNGLKITLPDSLCGAITFRCLKAICLVLFFSLISFYFYRDILDNWFIRDDLVALFHSMASVKEILLDNRFSNVFYTPLAILSLKSDFLMFGLNPFLYHVHNFIILIFVCFMFYKVMRLYADRLNSFIPAALILFSLPSLVMVSWITLRQYLYPVLLFLVVLYLFKKYSPDFKNNKLLTVGLLLLVELCFLAKEQFMTLPFVLLLFANGNIKKRVVDISPFFILLLFHFLFRMYILRGLGGYIGMTFEPITYVATIFKSFLFSSRVVYGYELLFLITVVPLLISSLKKSCILFSIWVFALGIQFLTMTEYPDILSLRYWFVPSLLICSIFSLGAQAIKNNILRASYILVIAGFFLLNTLSKSGEIKSFFKKESLFHESVANAMIDKKYSDSIIVIFDNFVMERNYFIKMINAIYSEKLGLKTYPTFIPADFLIFYPQFIKSRDDGIYELRQDMVSDITLSLEEKLEKYRTNFLTLSPILELATKDPKGQMLKINCTTPSKRIIFYVITKRVDKNKKERIFYDKILLPYAEEIAIRSLTKLKHVEIIIKEKVLFDGKNFWQVNNKDLEPFPSEALAFFSCGTVDDKITFPTDVLYLRE